MDSRQISYADNSNITQMPGVGTMEYGNSGKPYRVTMLTPTGTAVPVREQSVTYTSFQRPNNITKNGIYTFYGIKEKNEKELLNINHYNDYLKLLK